MRLIPIPGGTIAEVSRQVASALAAAGVSDAPSEARWLVRAALGLSAAELISRSEEVVALDLTDKVAAYLARRARHEPLSRIAGERDFYGRTFIVTPDTLDPRPDTETLVDATLAMLSERERAATLRILDVGTGTGCILLTLLAELPAAIGVGTDLSRSALDVAQRNAERLGLTARASFRETDLASGIDGPFDILVSNPPYIRTGDIAGLDAAVRNYDPHLALDGGADGLQIYQRLAGQLPRLVPSGLVLLETGYDQAAPVADLLAAAFGPGGQIERRIFNDVAGIPRVVAARTRMRR